MGLIGGGATGPDGTAGGIERPTAAGGAEAAGGMLLVPGDAAGG